MQQSQWMLFVIAKVGGPGVALKRADLSVYSFHVASTKKGPFLVGSAGARVERVGWGALLGAMPDKEADEKENAEKRALGEKQAALKAFEEKVKEELTSRSESVQQKAAAGDFDAAEFSKMVADQFTNMIRNLMEAGTELQQAGSDVARKQLRTQHLMNQLKLETSRTASEVAITNQKAELEASHHRALEEKVNQLSSNEGAVLAEAHGKIEELQQRLNGLTSANKATEETLVTTQKLHRAAEGSLERANAQVTKLKADEAEAKQQLSEALKDLKITTNEKQTLGEKVQELVAAFEESQKRCAELQTELDQGDSSKAKKIEALEFECEQLRSEIQTSKDTLEQVMADLNMKTDENMTLAEQVKSLVDQYENAKADIEKCLNEVQESQETLSTALSDLGQTKQENKSLGDQVRELVAQYEAALKEIRDSKATLEDALKDLNMTKDNLSSAKHENMTLSEKIAELIAQFEASRKSGADLTELLSARDTEIAELRAAEEAMRAGAAGDLIRANDEIARLKLEMKTATDSLAKVMSDLNLKTDENMTLAEQVKSLVDQYENAKADIEKCLNEVQESQETLSTALSDLGQTKQENKSLGDQVRELVAQYEAALKEIRDSKATLEDALQDLDMTRTDLNHARMEKMTLGEKVAELVAQFEAAKKEIAQSKDVLSEALRDLSATNGELVNEKSKTKTLGQQVGELLGQFDLMRREMSQSGSALQEALADLNLTKGKNQTLGQQVRELISQYELSKRENLECRSMLERTLADLNITVTERKSLAEHLNELLAKMEDLKKGDRTYQVKLRNMESELTASKAENKELRAEAKHIKSSLDEALSSVIGLTGDKRKLSDQVKDLVKRYRMTCVDLETLTVDHARAIKKEELATAEKNRVCKESDEKVLYIQEQSVRERTALVGAALRSMQELRTHLTSQWSSGTRVQEPINELADDKMAFVSWKSRWGDSAAVRPGRPLSARNDMMVVRLERPQVPPLNVKPLPPSPRLRRARAVSAPGEHSMERPPSDRLAAWQTQSMTQKLHRAGLTGLIED